MADPIGWLGTHVGLPGDGGIGFLPGGRTFRAEELPGAGGFLVWAADDGAGAPALRLRLRLLGGAEAELDGRPLHLSPRHAEILALLAASPDGLSAGELGAALHGAGASSTTVRSEISRLRRQLGPALATRPYRLVAEVDADFLSPASEGDPELLPGSVAPGITRLREARAA
jgi:hypothetical protein